MKTCPNNHERFIVVASHALVSVHAELVRGKVNWCIDCGAIKGEVDDAVGTWMLPGSADTEDAFFDAFRKGMQPTAIDPEGTVSDEEHDSRTDDV